MPRFDLADYISVQERIVRFWNEYPDGRIITALVSSPSDYERVIFKAEVYKHRDYPLPDATGWDGEVAGTGGANNTAHHANSETSAIGRALANMGYATSQHDRPSREEMARVNQQSGQQRPATPRGDMSAAIREAKSRAASAMTREQWSEAYAFAGKSGVTEDAEVAATFDEARQRIKRSAQAEPAATT